MKAQNLVWRQWTDVARWSAICVLLGLGLLLGEAGGGCTCHQSPGLVAILPNPITDGGNEITCACTIFATGSCTAGCANQQSDGGGPCPAIFTFFNPKTLKKESKPNCLSLTPQICLPPGQNPQLPGCFPAPAIPSCPVDPAEFCQASCTQLGTAGAELFGDPCGATVLPNGSVIQTPLQTLNIIATPVPAASGGPLVQDVASCNLPCPAVTCTASSLLAGQCSAGSDGGSGCCTVLSTCSVQVGPLCEPGDVTGVLGDMVSRVSLGQLDPNSSATLTLTGSNPGSPSPVSGTLRILGAPCADGNCSVGLDFDLLPAPLTTPLLTLSDLQINGATQTPGSVALSGGAGAVNLADLDVTAVATGSVCLFPVPIVGGCFPLSISGSEAVEEIPQPEIGAEMPTLGVDFAGHSFSLAGTFHFSGDSADQIPPFDVTLNLSGTLLNEPPTADAGPDQTVECTSPQGAEVTLDGTGSTDPDDNINIYSWHQGDPWFGPDVGSSAVTQIEAPFDGSGTTVTTYGLSVMDRFGQMDQALTTITVTDTQPPVIESVASNPSCLWPPNHEMVLLRLGREIQAQVHDSCDASPTVSIKSVTDNQPLLGGGSGNTTPDFVFGKTAVCLRAERDGTVKTPREYTVTVVAIDGAGNESTPQSFVVSVPHDQGQGHGLCPELPPDDLVPDGDPACTAGELDGGAAAAPSEPGPGPSVLPQVGAGSENIEREHGCASAAGEPADLAFGALLILWITVRRRKGGSAA
ncbi:MAG: PKD domain-containing protein [Myxococcales bacterium]